MQLVPPFPLPWIWCLRTQSKKKMSQKSLAGTSQGGTRVENEGVWGGGRIRATSGPTKRSSRFLVDPLLLLVTQRSLRLSSTGLYTFASLLVKILIISFAVHRVQNLLLVFPVSCGSCDLLLFCSQYEGSVLCSQKIDGVSFVLPG